MIGGGDWAEDRIIPDAVRAVTNARAIEIRSPNAVRPWQHVLEPLSGYMLLAAKLLSGDNNNFADGWNFGPKANTKPANVLTIIKTFYAVWGKGEVLCDESKANLHEAAYLTLSSKKAEEVLGWKQQWNLEETIEKTAEWYKKFSEGCDAYKLCMNDIEVYEKYLEY